MVSVLIITWKRAALLQKCLASLAPWAREADLQVVVVLNGDDAETRSLLESYGQSWLEWQEIPATTPGAARNAGLARLRGEWCFFIDDDARVPPDYLWHRRRTLEEVPQVDVFGGPDGPDPDDAPLARALALALASPFCSGPTAGRHCPRGEGPREADETTLTSCNLWVRTKWLRSHSFPVAPRRGEETVLLKELNAAGARLCYVPGLRVWPARRDRWSEIGRTSFWSGHWRSRHGGGPWFLLPALFVPAHALALTGAGQVLAFAGVAVVAVWFADTCLRERRWDLWARMVALHWFVPFTYGLGRWHGMMRWNR